MRASRRRLGVWGLCSVLVACAGSSRRPDGGVGLLPPGAPAPEVVGRDREGREVRLSEARGRPAVVYFYPRDASPGCTKEACAFRDAWNGFRAAGVILVGVSSNTAEQHAAFQRAENLPFALAADRDGKIAAAYGVPHAFWGHARVTFLVGRDGRVARVWPDVDPGVHAREVLSAAASLP